MGDDRIEDMSNKEPIMARARGVCASRPDRENVPLFYEWIYSWGEQSSRDSSTHSTIIKDNCLDIAHSISLSIPSRNSTLINNVIVYLEIYGVLVHSAIMCWI